jgi:Tfp pilus assembly protein PilF
LGPALAFAIRTTETMNSDPLMQAFQLFQNGQYDEAGESCRLFLAGNPDHAEMNHLFGVIRFQQGRMVEALDLMKRAVSAPAATAEMYNNYGAVLNKVGRTEEAIVAFNRALALRPDYADALNNLGVIYRDAKNTDAAIAAFRKAVELGSDSTLAKANLRSTYRDVVPAWHFAMMDDKRRNGAYDAAIRRVVPGKRVLDIGTGAGLLAMMAARAGAAHVTTCETVGLIAERAREIVARNGLSDRITVIAKPSTELVVGRDLPERAEVLVTETFASGLISEGILPTVEHAHEHLLTPNAAVIPAAASVMGYLAGGDTLKGMLFVDRIDGFDLSLFNDFAPPSLVANLDGVPHSALSDDITLIRFDLKEERFPMATTRRVIRTARQGVCVGVAQWIRLDLDAQTRYENRPSADADFNGHWAHMLYRFPHLVTVEPGDTVPVIARHDRSHIGIDLSE